MRAAQLAIGSATQNVVTTQKIAQLGFSARRMQEGKDLLKVVQQTQQRQKTHSTSNRERSHRIEQHLQTLHPIFMDHVSAVRFIFRRQPAILHTFKVDEIALDKWTWVEQARTFYEAMPPHYEQMAIIGVPRKELEQAQAAVVAVLALRDDQLQKKGETEARSQARKMLKEWVRDFHAAARLALKDNPQQLEACGIKESAWQK